MEEEKNENKLFTFDDKATVLVGIEIELKKIAYFISFYKHANKISQEGTLNFDNSNFRIDDDYLKVLLKELKKEIVNEISKIEKIIENKILWIFCVNSEWNENQKNKLRLISISAGLINSPQDKRVVILEKGMALTSYFEKEKNIKIEQGNPYIIIIAYEGLEVECLEKNYIEEKDQIETARRNFYKYES